MLAPQPSWLIVLVNYHLLLLQSPTTFGIHLLVTYTLTFLAFSSLIVCIARDPGPVGSTDGAESNAGDSEDGDEVGLTQALMLEEPAPENPAKWCKYCSVRSCSQKVKLVWFE